MSWSGDARSLQICVRHAHATFKAAKKAAALKIVKEELVALVTALNEPADGRIFKFFFEGKQKRLQNSFCEDVARKFELHDVTKNLMLVLVGHGRGGLLTGVAEKYLDLYWEHQGECRAVVYHNRTEGLTEEMKERLADELSSSSSNTPNDHTIPCRVRVEEIKTPLMVCTFLSSTLLL
eukprot:Trichotokara_eunicae@DN6140_c0_g1_i2.p1